MKAEYVDSRTGEPSKKGEPNVILKRSYDQRISDRYNCKYVDRATGKPSKKGKPNVILKNNFFKRPRCSLEKNEMGRSSKRTKKTPHSTVEKVNNSAFFKPNQKFTSAKYRTNDDNVSIMRYR